MESSTPIAPPGDRSVYRAQLATLIGFSCFAAVVILWIARLMYVSWLLEDVFSASIGIALVAVPVFLTLAIVFNYVFWGLQRGRQAHPHAP